MTQTHTDDPKAAYERLQHERRERAEAFLKDSGQEWPAADVLSTECGRDDHECDLVVICGRLVAVPGYDWYVMRALNELARVACYQRGGRAGRLKYKSVNYEFVWRFRSAIRENYQHGHNLPDSGFESLQDIRSFIRSIERAENHAMRGGDV
jgi:hypothetical protein